MNVSQVFEETRNIQVNVIKSKEHKITYVIEGNVKLSPKHVNKKLKKKFKEGKYINFHIYASCS